MLLAAGLRIVSISAPLTGEDQHGEAALTWCSPSRQSLHAPGILGKLPVDAESWQSKTSASSSGCGALQGQGISGRGCG